MARLQNFYCAFLLGVTSAAKFDFTPERTGVTGYGGNLPDLYSLHDSQLLSEESNSYWAASFVTATNGHQYAVLSQALPYLSGQSSYSYAVLDLEDTNNYWRTYGSLPLKGNTTKDGVLNIELDGYGFKGVSQDSLSTINTWGESETVGVNITFDSSSPVILNGGVGQFRWGSGKTTQWSLPSCETRGTFTINNTVLEVDPERSLTWYDRQHGIGGPDNFTWFGVVFPGNVKASIWFSNTAEPNYQQLRFATVRASDGVHLVRFDMEEAGETWTSLTTNITYPLGWSLKFENGDDLTIKTARPDQERPTAVPFYSGVIEAEGNFFGGLQHGFGVVDIIPSLVNL